MDPHTRVATMTRDSGIPVGAEGGSQDLLLCNGAAAVVLLPAEPRPTGASAGHGRKGRA